MISQCVDPTFPPSTTDCGMSRSLASIVLLLLFLFLTMF
ncbi:hypothetical protein SynBIOSU31_02677 [Synechococcus sp. BIOS-U3-1]|nr:hypothetical protein SynBIOSU31_02677 [Synechococcus sp. BIOS-U3-1]